MGRVGRAGLTQSADEAVVSAAGVAGLDRADLVVGRLVGGVGVGREIGGAKRLEAENSRSDPFSTD